MRHLLPAACLGFLPMAIGADAAEQSRPQTSRHLSHAIQEGFRKDDGQPTATEAEEREVPVEAEIRLPTMTVTGPRTDSRAFIAEVPPKPVLGTSVTEFKGKKFTFKMRRILFVPVAFKLEW